MKILFLHQHFHPETVGTSTRAVEIVEHLVGLGHEVTVVAGIPSHPSTMQSGEVSRRQPREESFRGARVIRTWAYGSPKPDRFFRRMLSYGSFMILGCIRALFVRGSFDALVAISPLPNGIAGVIVSKARGIPLMFDVCDIWPDCAIAVGMLPNRFLQRLSFALEGWVYRNSVRVGVVTRGFTENLASKGVPRGKVALLPDWVDPALYDSSRVDRDAVRAEFGLEGRYVVSFLGNFGLLMGIEKILETARLVKDSDPEVLFLFVGKGVALPMMEEKVREWSLANVKIIPYQPRSRVPAMLAASDALIVTYAKDDITRITVPSKIYEYMSSARPVVAGVEGVISDILGEAGCGLVSPSRDPAEMAGFISRLKRDPELSRRMGENGRRYASGHFAFARVAADYAAAVGETARREAPRPDPAAPPAGEDTKPGASPRPFTDTGVRLSVILINLNTHDFLKACLASMRTRLDDPSFEVILVDNGSTDGSVEMVTRDFPQVRVFPQGTNLGFTKANNIGLREARGHYLLVLNSDTEIVDDALERMCDYMDANPDIGALGAQLLNTDRTVQLSCRAFPSYRTVFFHRYSLLTRLFPRNRYSAEYLMTETGHSSTMDVDWVSGACLLTRRETTDQVGLLDEGFFIYAEDVDWCYRMKQAGWRVVYYPETKVLHHIGRATRKIPYKMTLERHKSMWRFYRKHYSRGIVLVDVATFLGIAARCGFVMLQNFIKPLLGTEKRG